MSGVNAMLAAASVVRGQFLTTLYKPFRPIINMVFRDHARAPHLFNIAKNAALTGYQATTNVRLTASQKEHVSPQKDDADRPSNGSGSGKISTADAAKVQSQVQQRLQRGRDDGGAVPNPEAASSGSDSPTRVRRKSKSKAGKVSAKMKNQ